MVQAAVTPTRVLPAPEDERGDKESDWVWLAQSYSLQPPKRTTILKLQVGS